VLFYDFDADMEMAYEALHSSVSKFRQRMPRGISRQPVPFMIVSTMLVRAILCAGKNDYRSIFSTLCKN
jgi:hypothetical protein